MLFKRPYLPCGAHHFSLDRRWDHKLVSVKTDRPIPKEKIGEAIGELCDITINAPVGRGDIIIKNIADTDANIIATRDVRLSS